MSEEKRPCGICEPRKLRSGLCDYHAKAVVEHGSKHNISIAEATDQLYQDAVKDLEESEEGSWL